ncbi:MAG: DNA-deoxyinosine glycosylase [Hydrogenophilales bacterium 28-61-23]|nr:MAG: DNA-deoxyinosine glycosylase [Hydrogenophilales bacterium 28-61-23]
MTPSARNSNISETHWAQSFPPIENPNARVLILGSMPGIASLRAGQYYAHPRNQFWPIMAALLDADLPALTYARRVDLLAESGIALWDVLQSCRRHGSLDAAIAPETAIANDFPPFFARHTQLTHIFFNGAAAERHFNRQVHGRIELPPLRFQRLPSTSPAHAALDFSAKLAAWRAVAEALQQTS